MARLLQDIQRGTQIKVDAERRQLLTEPSPRLLRQLRIPSRPDGHLGRQGGHLRDKLGERHAGRLIVQTDQQWDICRGLRTRWRGISERLLPGRIKFYSLETGRQSPQPIRHLIAFDEIVLLRP